MNKRGSNQYKDKYALRPDTKRTLAYLFFLMLVVALVGFFAQLTIKDLQQKRNIKSPLAWSPSVYAAEIYKEPQIDLAHKDGVIAVIKKVWGKDARVGIAISQCESGFRPDAENTNTNGTKDEGPFQINTVHKMPEMKTVTANVLYAYQMYKEQGTNPWNSSKHCWSQKI